MLLKPPQPFENQKQKVYIPKFSDTPPSIQFIQIGLCLIWIKWISTMEKYA